MTDGVGREVGLFVFDAEGRAAEVELVGIGTTAQTHIHRIDGREVLCRQRKVKDVDILGNPFGSEGLRDGDEPMINVPAEDDLCRGLAILSGKLDDDRMREGILSGARSRRLANAATEWRPRLRGNAKAGIGLAQVPLEEVRVDLDLI